jgi:hypothetical protein
MKLPKFYIAWTRAKGTCIEIATESSEALSAAYVSALINELHNKGALCAPLVLCGCGSPVRPVATTCGYVVTCDRCQVDYTGRDWVAMAHARVEDLGRLGGGVDHDEG